MEPEVGASGKENFTESLKVFKRGTVEKTQPSSVFTRRVLCTCVHPWVWSDRMRHPLQCVLLSHAYILQTSLAES